MHDNCDNLTNCAVVNERREETVLGAFPGLARFRLSRTGPRRPETDRVGSSFSSRSGGKLRIPVRAGKMVHAFYSNPNTRVLPTYPNSRIPHPRLDNVPGESGQRERHLGRAVRRAFLKKSEEDRQPIALLKSGLSTKSKIGFEGK